MGKGKSKKAAKKSAKKARALDVAGIGGGGGMDMEDDIMAPRSTVPGKKGKGKAKKGKKKGAAGDYDAVLANAIDMLDFAIDGGGGGGGGGPSLPEAPKPTSKKKGKGKNKNKKANFKALPQATLDAVEEALGMCWNPDTLALIMPNFFSAPCLMGHEVNDGWANAAFCNALVKKVEEHCGAAVTLDISTNGIKSLAPIRRLAAAMPNIEQLSLASNELKSVAELGHFKGMEQIRCIVLQGNSALERREKEPIAYEKGVRKYFPKVAEIDGLELSSAMPLNVVGGFVPAGLTETIDAFIAKYFGCFDTPGRAELCLAYGPHSVMSLTLNLSGGVSYPQCYKAINRNLRNQKLQKKAAGPMAERVCLGEEIIATHRTFPETVHSPNLLIDAWVMTDDLLGLNITGTFEEKKPNGGKHAVIERPFHRTFLLSPANPDSEAAANGWPVTVANEQLHIGPLSNAPVKPVATAAAPPSVALLGPPVADQDGLLLEFMRVTGMNEEFAAQCLGSNDWNPDLALEDFHALQASGALPPEAFSASGAAEL